MRKMSSLLSLKEVHSVRGNCDVYSSLPSEETFACGGKPCLSFTVTQEG